MELRTTDDDGIRTLTLDDGARNALVPETFEDLTAALDDAEADEAVRAVVLAGNGEVFTAGLDVKWMRDATRDDVGAMLVLLGRTLVRLWTFPRPTVAACTGHSLAAGTMLAMACDHAVAADGEYRWGLMETRIAFEMPLFGIELARANVAGHRVDDLILPGAVCSPAEAVEVGFADALAPLDETLEQATALARELAELPAHTYAGTKQRLRGDAAARILADIEADIAAVMSTSPIAG